MNKINSIDEKLVRLLGRNAQQNSETLAKQLNVSAATVRRKLKKLIQSGSLRIVGVADPSEFGYPMGVVITLDMEHDKIEEAMRVLAKRPEIGWLSSTTGRYDIIAVGGFSSTEGLSHFLTRELAKLEGLRGSETFVVLDNKKGHFIPLT
ncbi:MAG TPA: Lrp/AsnC family transcriptional regulator [Dehalococcoidia bacterium]|nr:Lrp/AsnC family transcriptional regulator [Dehalococcoidia bacterium]